MDNSPMFDQFDDDYKLKHVILNNVKYWDIKNEELKPARLELFGHCFQMTINSTNQGMRSISSPDVELEYTATPSKNSNDLIVTLDSDNDKMFVMSLQNLDLLRQHYQEMNKHIPALKESYKNDVNSKVSLLLTDNGLVEMAENFISNQPVSFYTNPDYLMLVECAIDMKWGNIGSMLLLTSKESRSLFIKENMKFIEDYQVAAMSYLKDEFGMFRLVINEKAPPVDNFVAYVFVYNIIVEFFAKKWEREYKQFFLDIGELDLDSAIERYCSIETIDHKNIVSVGTFVYYLIKRGKFEQGNRNYLDCMSFFIPKLDTRIAGKKYTQFVNRLKTPKEKEKYSIDDVDLMNGREFEIFIAKLFSQMGYETEVTKTTKDQGIDVIASKNGNKIGIQAKCYSGIVGNSAIQEVVAGKNYYHLDKGMVITNSLFSDAAQKLAQANSIILWDRNILKEKIDVVFNSGSY